MFCGISLAYEQALDLFLVDVVDAGGGRGYGGLVREGAVATVRNGVDRCALFEPQSGKRRESIAENRVVRAALWRVP